MNLVPQPRSIEMREGRFRGPGAPALRADGSLAPEAYRLEIRPEGIEICSSGDSGAFYALQTLRQIEDEYGDELPACVVRDEPRFPWRGVLLDSCRSYQSPAFILKFLELMAYHKLNRFHWHLCDDQAWRLEIPELPELAARGSRRRDRRFEDEQWREGSYSPEDVRAIVERAAELRIAVIPEIESPGHAMAALASHPELSCSGGPFEVPDSYGIFDDVFCAGNDAVFGLLAKVYDYLAEAFPGPWVHAGGDECPRTRWESCPRCRERMRRESLPDAGALEGWFMKRVAALLAARGKTMIGWDEIADGDCPPGALIMAWRSRERGLAAAARGHEVVMCPEDRACYLDHQIADSPEEAGQLGVCTLEDSYGFDPIPPGAPPEAEKRILGGQASLWTELMYSGRQVEYMAFPRLCALAEVFWSPRGARDLGSFRRRLAAHRRRLDLLDVSYNPGPFREGA